VLANSTILASADGGGATSLIILLLIPLAMYFLLIRPQRRRMKEQQTLQRSIEIGDEVVTTSGIFGFVTGVEDDRFWLEIDDDVQIRIARAAVQSRVPTAPADAGDDAERSGADDGDQKPSET
jgi:preprotein translocase subunit YajC